MSFLNRLRSALRPAAAGGIRAEVDYTQFESLNDPRLIELIRTGKIGANVSIEAALCNTSVYRCVDIISATMGMLPLYLNREVNGSIERATDHQLYDVLRYQPNSWQTPFEFKRLMQGWALSRGNAYAQIVKSGNKVIQLVPLHPARVSVEQLSNWSLKYTVTRANGSVVELPQSEVLHIKDYSDDGIKGLSRVQQAANTISLELEADSAAQRIFQHGMMVGGALSVKGKLSDTARNNLRESMEKQHAGSKNAGKWMILEDGLEAKQFTSTAKEAQLIETQSKLVEKIARVFGVPRPLMGVDDTSWGSGIEQLAILFVRFGLAPWFIAWEDAISRSCLTLAERKTLKPDFDETELLRGTLKDQAEFFARALGSGGHRPWMEVNEVRESVGLGQHTDGSGLISAGEATNVNP